MGKFEDLLDLLLADDDDEEATEIGVEVVVGKEQLDKRIKELEEEGFKLVGEDDSSKEDEEDKEEKEEKELVEKLHKSAMKQYNEISEKVGKERADQVVDLAAHCAMISGLLRDNIPLDQDMVDEYNAICKKVYPERSSPFMRAIAYMAMRQMAKEGIESLG